MIKITYLVESIIQLEKGAGPRHMVIHNDFAYVSNELKSTVVVAKLDGTELNKNKKRFTPIQYVSTIPEGSKTANYVSEVKKSKDGRFLYVSNRGDDSIAIYRINQVNGKLERIAITKTGGKFPRHFAFSPEEDYLLVANQDSNSVNVFSRDKRTGLLTATDRSYKIPTPNYIRFFG